MDNNKPLSKQAIYEGLKSALLSDLKYDDHNYIYTYVAHLLTALETWKDVKITGRPLQLVP